MHMAVYKPGQKIAALSIHHLIGFAGGESEYAARADADTAGAYLAAEHIHDAGVVYTKFCGGAPGDHIEIRSGHVTPLIKKSAPRGRACCI